MPGLTDWFDARLGYRSAADRVLHRRLPRSIGWQHTFGSATLFLLVVQAITGVALTMNYAPTPDHAYDSIRYIETEIAFGRLIRGLHRWSATLLMVMIGLHILRVFRFGAYKRPRELTWIVGVFLLLVVMAFGFTGYLLPWDQKAYWATVVGTHILETVPGIGAFLARVARGGSEVGANTLTRFFSLHVLILPGVLLALIAIHLVLVVRLGIAGISQEEEARKTGPWFYPEHLIKDTLMAFVLLGAAFALAMVYGAPLDDPADPAAVGYVPRPEWYFIWLYRLLWYFKGPLEIVGTVIIPAALLAFFLLLPFLDRTSERGLRRRPVVAGAGFAFVVALGFLSLSGAQAPKPPTASVDARARMEQALPASARMGKELYDGLGCASCHSIAGAGSGAGPDLTRVGSERNPAWLTRFFVDPGTVVPGGTMPKYDLSHEQVDNLVEYMMTLR